MPRELTKKSFHLDLPKYLKTTSTHPYNLRPRRKRVNYNDNLKSSIHQQINEIQDPIQIDESVSNRYHSGHTSLQKEFHEPAQVVTHFVNDNFGNASVTDITSNKLQQDNSNKLELSSHKSNDEEGNEASEDADESEENPGSIEGQSVGTVEESQSIEYIQIDQVTEDEEDAGQESDSNDYNEDENIDIARSNEDLDDVEEAHQESLSDDTDITYQYASSNGVDEDFDEEAHQDPNLNDINENENFSNEGVDVNGDNLTDSEDDGADLIRFQFNSDYSYSSTGMQNYNIDPTSGVNDFDTRAMGDGRHNRPNLIEFDIYMAIVEDDFE